MSDGPHRSLPMRRPWKELAKRGDQDVYDVVQVAEAATLALASDFKKEVSWSLINTLKSIFACDENSLGLPEIAVQQLEQARAEFAGSVFGRNAVEWSIQLVHEGRLEPNAVYEAIGLAAKERGYANTRAIQEHVLRKTNQLRAESVANRLESAISGLSEVELGTKLIDRQTNRNGRLTKSISLDEGVPL